MTGVLPAPAEWNAAVGHSNAYPTHILGPYEDAWGVIHMCCDGDGDAYEPSNCDFTTEPPRDSRGHDERCCMEGVRPTAGPHPDCPGFEALRQAAATGDEAGRLITAAAADLREDPKNVLRRLPGATRQSEKAAPRMRHGNRLPTTLLLPSPNVRTATKGKL